MRTANPLDRHLRLCPENQRRRPRCFEFANFFETRLFKPPFDFVETKSVTAFGIHEHLNSEHERVRWFSALVVYEPFGDSDHAAGFERAKSFLEQLAAAFFAFAMQDVAQSGDVVAAAEIRVHYIALDIIKAIAHGELLRDS